MVRFMSDDKIVCPNCRAQIKLTESLAAPLLDAVRADHERALVTERVKIAAEEAQKAKALLQTDLATRDQDLATLKNVLLDREQKLTKAHAAQVEFAKKERELNDARREFELTVEARVKASVAERESEIEATKRLLKEQRAAMAREVAERIAAERASIADEEAKKAKSLFQIDITERDKKLNHLNDLLKDKEDRLAKAQIEQANFEKKTRELEDAKRELDLTVEARVRQEIVTIRDKTKLDVEGEYKLKLTASDEKMASMQRKIEELSRKAEQGSQQLQGEALELELETRLKEHFPEDIIERIPTGRNGADVLQRVCSTGGKVCGSILWETKRTKAWKEDWLPKLRDDQRAAKADMAIIVSSSMPKGITPFGHRDGVWVAEFGCAIPVAASLRQSLLAMARLRTTQEGQRSKMEEMYEYLTGPEFHQRVSAIAERFNAMQVDLTKERNFMVKQWAARERQIRGVLDATLGMRGDLQGIAGRDMLEIESINLQLLDTATEA